MNLAIVWVYVKWFTSFYMMNPLSRCKRLILISQLAGCSRIFFSSVILPGAHCVGLMRSDSTFSGPGTFFLGAWDLACFIVLDTHRWHLIAYPLSIFLPAKLKLCFLRVNWCCLVQVLVYHCRNGSQGVCEWLEQRSFKRGNSGSMAFVLSEVDSNVKRIVCMPSQAD